MDPLICPHHVRTTVRCREVPLLNGLYALVRARCTRPAANERHWFARVRGESTDRPLPDFKDCASVSPAAAAECLRKSGVPGDVEVDCVFYRRQCELSGAAPRLAICLERAQYGFPCTHATKLTKP